MTPGYYRWNQALCRVIEEVENAMTPQPARMEQSESQEADRWSGESHHEEDSAAYGSGDRQLGTWKLSKVRKKASADHGNLSKCKKAYSTDHGKKSCEFHRRLRRLEEKMPKLETELCRLHDKHQQLQKLQKRQRSESPLDEEETEDEMKIYS